MMKVDGNTIKFKSVPEMFEKERSGRKPNTVRRSDDAGEVAQMEMFARDVCTSRVKCIQIENSETGETFLRLVTDVSLYGDIYIFSWMNSKH